MKVRNLKPLSFSVFVSHWHVKGLSSQHTALIVSRSVIGPKKLLFYRRVRVSFSPENLQVGAVKGLKDHNDKIELASTSLSTVESGVGVVIYTPPPPTPPSTSYLSEKETGGIYIMCLLTGGNEGGHTPGTYI